MNKWTGSYPFLGIALMFSSALTALPMTVFAAQAAPFAITKAPTFITEKSARLNGSVNSNEMPDTMEWFEWGVVGRSNVLYETRHIQAWGGTQLQDTSADLSGLAPNEQYFYRQVAENSRGKDVGQVVYFTSKPLPNPIDPIIIVQTNAPSSITDTSAILKGYISPHGNPTVRYWFDWGITDRLENETVHNSWGGDSGPVQVNITALTPGTVYFYRMVGENAQGEVYGATRSFMTTGTAPQSEAPRQQSVPEPQPKGDGVTRTTTNNGQGTTQGGIFGANATRPGDFFGLGSLFGKKQNNTGAKASTTAQNTTANQVAAAGASNPVGAFWNSLTGKKSIEVNIQKIGPDKVPAHTAIEYQISYAYRMSQPATNAKLKIVLPAEAVYIGDNTVNELLLEEGEGPERTYVLPLGRLENGSTRTISILAMTTGEANGSFPDARVHLEYTDASGVVQVVGTTAGVQSEKTTAPSGGSSFSILPGSLIGWLLYVIVIVGAIVGIRKAKAYYEKRKQEIEAEKNSSGNNNDSPKSQPA